LGNCAVENNLRHRADGGKYINHSA